MEYTLTIYVAYSLLHRFPSKKAMASQTGIPYRTLLRLFRGQSTTKDVAHVMEGMARYCMIRRIPPEELFQGFCVI